MKPLCPICRAEHCPEMRPGCQLLGVALRHFDAPLTPPYVAPPSPMTWWLLRRAARTRAPRRS